METKCERVTSFMDVVNSLECEAWKKELLELEYKRLTTLEEDLRFECDRKQKTIDAYMIVLNETIQHCPMVTR